MVPEFTETLDLLHTAHRNLGEWQADGSVSFGEGWRTRGGGSWRALRHSQGLARRGLGLEPNRTGGGVMGAGVCVCVRGWLQALAQQAGWLLADLGGVAQVGGGHGPAGEARGQRPLQGWGAAP